MNRRRFLGLTGLATLGAQPVLTTPVHAAASSRWQPDGAGSIARIGVLTPDYDPVPESEMSAMAPRGVSIHASRVQRDPTSTPAAFAESPHVDTATEQLAKLALKAIVFAYTSSSYVLDAQAEDSTRARLEARAGGIPVVMTCPAATRALHALAVKRVALVNPPWFSEEVSAKGGDYFRARGFDVVLCERLTPTRSFTEVPHKEVEVPPADVFEWVRTHTPTGAQAVLIGGNGLRAVGAIRALEATLRRPVLTANQVAFWAALRTAKVRADIADYGRIFQRDS